MVAYAFRMPAGIPGEITRASVGFTTEPQLQMVGNPLPYYGMPVVIDPGTGGMRPAASGDTAAVIYGIIVRPFPTQPTATSGYSGAVAIGTPAVPPVTGIIDVLKRGYVNVLLTGTGKPAPVKGGAVRVWLAAAASGEIVGGFTTDTAATLIVTGAYFMGGADANGNTEIAFNI